MAKFPVLLCFVLLITLAVVVSVTKCDTEAVKSKDLQSHSEDDDKLNKLKGNDVDTTRKKDHDDEDDHSDDDNDGDDDDDDDDGDDNDDDDHKGKPMPHKRKKGGHDNDHDSDHDNDEDDDDKKKGGHDHEDDDRDDDDDDKDDDDDDDDDGDDDGKDKKKGGHDDGDEDDDDKVNADDDNEKENVGTYELKKGNMTVKLTNWGASIMSLLLPDKHGKMGDIVLGYDSVKDYMNDYRLYFGATVGRVANRIGKAQFILNAKMYNTVANEGKNTLHGGEEGFGNVKWAVSKYKLGGKTPFIVFTYLSPDGDQGFPGELSVRVTYKLVGTNELSVAMEAKPKDKATLVNLAHHTYWNLGGHDSGDILSEEIQILGSKYTPVDDHLIPTGKIVPVRGTPFDFLQLRPIIDNIKKLQTGYDINYCLEGEARTVRKAVELVDKRSGRRMELYTNQPGLQFYTGGRLKNIKGKNEAIYRAYGGLCLETQGFPDSVHYKNFPSQIVEADKTYKHVMRFKFSIVS